VSNVVLGAKSPKAVRRRSCAVGSSSKSELLNAVVTEELDERLEVRELDMGAEQCEEDRFLLV
jgi:hypothetical protein